MAALNHIYKANQCTDIDDVEIAINSVLEIIDNLRFLGKQTPISVTRRLISLKKRKTQLSR